MWVADHFVSPLGPEFDWFECWTILAAVAARTSHIRRTFFVGYTNNRPFDSEDALEDFIGRYREAGIDEFVFGYIPGFEFEEYNPSWILDEERLNYVAKKLLPT